MPRAYSPRTSTSPSSPPPAQKMFRKSCPANLLRNLILPWHPPCTLSSGKREISRAPRIVRATLTSRCKNVGSKEAAHDFSFVDQHPDSVHRRTLNFYLRLCRSSSFRDRRP